MKDTNINIRCTAAERELAKEVSTKMGYNKVSKFFWHAVDHFKGDTPCTIQKTQTSSTAIESTTITDQTKNMNKTI